MYGRNRQVDLVYLVLVTCPLPQFGIHGLNGQVDLVYLVLVRVPYLSLAYMVSMGR